MRLFPEITIKFSIVYAVTDTDTDMDVPPQGCVAAPYRRRDQELHIILDNLSAHKTPEFQNGRGETGCSLSLHAQEFLLAECIGGLVLTTGAAILMPRGIH